MPRSEDGGRPPSAIHCLKMSVLAWCGSCAIAAANAVRHVGDLPRVGLAFKIWCSRCKNTRTVKIDGRLANRQFGRQRYTRVSRAGNGSECGGSACPNIVPSAATEHGVALVFLNCPRCVPPWSASSVVLGSMAWATVPLDVKTERYRSPNCRGQVTAMFHARQVRARK